MFGGLKDKAKEKGAAAKEKAEELKIKATDFGMDKVERFFEEFNAVLPRLEAAGYRLVDLDISLGVPPKFAPCFQLARVVSEEEQAEHLAGLADNKRGHMMLSTLYKTSALQAKLDPGRLEPLGIVMEIGLTPVTRIRYVDQRRAEVVGAAAKG